MAESVSQPDMSVEQVVQDPQLLAHSYRFGDRDAVFGFLNADQSLVRLLWDVLPIIRTHFENSPITLRVVSDLEDDSPPKLMLAITPTTDLEDALARYDRLIYAWWQYYAQSTQGKLALSLGYQ